ncbi:MAG: hypothetical protein K8R92_00930 [Planctomycetes bacterium]|nr:hypothetical protein [Planctomycetota bacterium]
MQAETLKIVLELFSSAKWAKPTSMKYQTALDALAEFEDQIVIDATHYLRRALTRTFITSDELLQECKRFARRMAGHGENKALAARLAHETICDSERQESIARIKRSSPDAIRAAFQNIRESGITLTEPTESDPASWPRSVIGFVDAALARIAAASEQEGIFV